MHFGKLSKRSLRNRKKRSKLLPIKFYQTHLAHLPKKELKLNLKLSQWNKRQVIVLTSLNRIQTKPRPQKIWISLWCLWERQRKRKVCSSKLSHLVDCNCKTPVGLEVSRCICMIALELSMISNKVMKSFTTNLLRIKVSHRSKNPISGLSGAKIKQRNRL